MATAQHLKALIKSHFDSESERFVTLALQLAAHEAKMGHVSFAQDIRKIVDDSKTSRYKQMGPLQKGLQDIVVEAESIDRLRDLIVSDNLEERVSRILLEYRQRDKLRRHGLDPRRKILLSGPPGTGKTMTASIVSNELNLPLYIILMDKVVTKFMGETSSKLRQVFNLIKRQPGVYLFDEFDAIGAERGRENDVGEMRRVVNSFLQFIERDNSESVIIAATNNLGVLDNALFRRFDDVLTYQMPDKNQIIELIENRLASYRGVFGLTSVIPYAQGLSHAEITQACVDAIKESILVNRKKVSRKGLLKMFEQRKTAYDRN